MIKTETEYHQQFHKTVKALQELEYQLKITNDFIVRGSFGSCVRERGYGQTLNDFHTQLKAIAEGLDQASSHYADLVQFGSTHLTR